MRRRVTIAALLLVPGASLVALFCCSTGTRLEDNLRMSAVSAPPLHAGLSLPRVVITCPPQPAKATPRDSWQVRLQVAPAEPAETDWASFTEEYRLDLVLPDPSERELTDGERRIVHLPAYLKRLSQLTFSEAELGNNEDEEWVRSFGNLLEAFRSIRNDPGAIEQRLARVESGYPKVHEKVGVVLAELVRAEFLYSDDWRPSRTESAAGKGDDGILVGETWRVQAAPDRSEHWNSLAGSCRVHQGATVVFARLETIRRVERDFAGYFEHVPGDLIDVFPIDGSIRRGRDPAGREFESLDVLYHKNLGLLFGKLAYVHRNLDHFDSEGYLVTDNYAEPESLEGNRYFQWLAGRNTYIPVRTTTGEDVGVIIATNVTFEIAGVPELDLHRLEAMRSSLGNVKRLAERLETAADDAAAGR